MKKTLVAVSLLFALDSYGTQQSHFKQEPLLVYRMQLSEHFEQQIDELGLEHSDEALDFIVNNKEKDAPVYEFYQEMLDFSQMHIKSFHEKTIALGIHDVLAGVMVRFFKVESGMNKPISEMEAIEAIISDLQRNGKNIP